MAELAPEAFNALLAWLDVDKNRAGERYNDLRRRLIVFFEGRQCGSDSEWLADKTVDVVARKLREEQSIHSSESFAYCFGVARNIYRDWLGTHRPDPLEHDPKLPEDPSSEDEERVRCLDRCLGELPPESRRFILSYYEGKGRAKIDNHEGLARQLGLTRNALCIRAFTIRRKLEDCVGVCLGGKRRTEII